MNIDIKSIPGMVRDLAKLVAEPMPRVKPVIGPNGTTAIFAVKEGYKLVERESHVVARRAHTFFAAQDLAAWLGDNTSIRLMGPSPTSSSDTFRFLEEAEHGQVELRLQATAQYRMLVEHLLRTTSHTVESLHGILRHLDGCFGPVSDGGPDAGTYLLQQLSSLKITRTATTKVQRASNGSVLSVESASGQVVSANIPDRVTARVKVVCEFDVWAEFDIKVTVDATDGLRIQFDCPLLCDERFRIDGALVDAVRSVLPEKALVFNAAPAYSEKPASLGTPGKKLGERGY